MSQHYSNPARENEPGALPDIETFDVPRTKDRVHNITVGCPLCMDNPRTGFARTQAEIHNADHVGWYWWSCLPGCLPDSEPIGPFATEAEALADARRDVETDDDHCYALYCSQSALHGGPHDRDCYCSACQTNGGLAADDLPQCAIAMHCLCAAHAKGRAANGPCDANENVNPDEW